MKQPAHKNMESILHPGPEYPEEGYSFGSYILSNIIHENYESSISFHIKGNITS